MKPLKLTLPHKSPLLMFFLCTTILVLCSLPACTPKDPYTLSKTGPYRTGVRKYEFKDSSRGDREVNLEVRYPAVLPADSPPGEYYFDVEADRKGAPYPLILSSSRSVSDFGGHLASYGFVVVGIERQDSSNSWGQWLIDYPLDILFALNQVASQPLTGLEGMIDAEHAGAMGYSFDGYTALALSGARIDPQFYLSQCAKAAGLQPPPPAWWIEYICGQVKDWNEFVTHAGKSITTSTDGLWQPLTDPRIRAVMPMAPEGAWLFGERGLTAVDRPTLIIGATADDMNIYDLEAAYIFNHLGTTNRAMVSFVGSDHMMIYDSESVGRMKHFATAFFGYQLQGRKEYAGYFSQDFVKKQKNLAWGVYAK